MINTATIICNSRSGVNEMLDWLESKNMYRDPLPLTQRSTAKSEIIWQYKFHVRDYDPTNKTWALFMLTFSNYIIWIKDGNRKTSVS
jgi:hypothetical protein